jgi:hypothetical protein
MRSRVAVGLAFALVLVLGVELACWESFFVPARPLGLPLPLSALAAVVGNLVVGTAGARVLRSVAGAVVPGLLWLGVALTFGTGTAAGDVVVPETGRGIAFLIAGAAAAAAAVAMSAPNARSAPKPGATP